MYLSFSTERNWPGTNANTRGRKDLAKNGRKDDTKNDLRSLEDVQTRLSEF